MMSSISMPWWLPLIAAPFVGSFLALVVVRLPRGEPVVLGRSHCRACNQTLAPRDLVPLFSWLVNRGRCRYCGVAIDRFYPLMELACLAVAGWAILAVPADLVWITCALGWTLLALAEIDRRHFILPDLITLPLIGAGLSMAMLVPGLDIRNQVLGAAAGFAAFGIVALAYRRLRGVDGLGLGDAKLLAAAGAWVSWMGLPSVVLIAAVTTLVSTLFERWRSRRGNDRPDVRDARIAFGPYLCLGLWLTWLYGAIALGAG